MTRNLSLAMIWQMTYNHKLPKLCSATLNVPMTAQLLFVCLTTTQQLVNKLLEWSSTNLIKCNSCKCTERRFPFVAFLPPRERSDDRKCVCCSQAMLREELLLLLLLSLHGLTIGTTSKDNKIMYFI